MCGKGSAVARRRRKATGLWSVADQELLSLGKGAEDETYVEPFN
jgi:hypothetical protein